MRIRLTTITCGLALVLTATNAFGLSSYVNRIPNGSAFSCNTCHTANIPDTNPFGTAFASAGFAWGAALAGLNSDGDSASNGTELGDPTGAWRPGSPNPAGPVYNPGDPNSAPPAATAPSITTQPQSQTVTEGANVSFTVVASGTAPLSYQWMKGGVNVTGGTAATLTLNNVTTAAAGSYTVRVSNSAGNVTSSAATLTVNPAAVAPAITTQPQSQTVTAGANVSFTVVATGTAPLSYQWMKDGANVTGGNAATLTLNSVTTAAAGSYTVRVSNSAGNVTSSAATLTVNPAVVAPAITTQPQSQTVTAGANVSFTVVATGTAPLSYQWMKDGVNVTGGNAATLTLNSVTTAAAGSYTVRVSNSAGNVTSSAAVLTVNPAVVAPAITTQPQSQTVTAGANVSFTVVATGTAPLSYQWMKDGVNVTGGNAATLTLNSVTTAAAGSYTVRVSNSAGNVTSSAAVLTVNPAAVAPTITTQPQSQTVSAGANVSFTVVATGTLPLSYQWMKDGVNVTGGNAATLTLNSVTTAAAGSYTVRVSNSAGNVTSSAAVLTVNPVVVAPTITLQPVSQTVTAGANVSFGVAATGTAPLSYQWKKDGANISGATSASLILTSVTAANAGSYTVEVSNSAGSVTSSAATLTVNPAVLGIALTNPTNGATFVQSAVITLEAAVTPSSGIAAVQFVADDTNVLGVLTTAPYTLAVSNLALGEHVIVAEVADTQGATAASEAVTISIVSAPPGGMTPVVTIIAPRNYSRFGTLANIELVARVVHTEPSVMSVEFFSGSTRIGTGIPIRVEEDDEWEEDDDEREGMPGTVYAMVWNRVPAGQYTITAKAICSVGGIGTSAPVRINVRGRGYEHDRYYGERDGDRD